MARVRLRNNLHGTEFEIEATIREGEYGRWVELSDTRAAWSRKHLCGRADCSCPMSGALGPQTDADGIPFSIMGEPSPDNTSKVKAKVQPKRPRPGVERKSSTSLKSKAQRATRHKKGKKMANTKVTMEHIAFRVPTEDVEWLDSEAAALAKATRLKVSRSDIIRRLIIDAREAQAPPTVQKGRKARK